MDPEPDMIAEGEKRAAAAGITNLAFVLGGSDDLPSLGRDLGPLVGATISQAFHWMRDQDEVLRTLGGLLDGGSGSIAIVSFVKRQDPNRLWLDAPPWNVVEEIRRRYLKDVAAGQHPRGRHEPFPELLRRSAFSNVDLLTHEYDAVIHPSVEAAIGFQYTLSNIFEQLGERRAAFEAEARAALKGADLSPITVRLVDSALVGRRPTL